MAASLAVRPSGWQTEQFGRLSLVAALAGRSVLDEDIACKWPNDLVRGRDKIAGLLLEASDDLVVIGLGVNLWWPDPPAGIGSLFTRDPGPEVIVDLANQWCVDLLARIQHGPARWGRKEYLRWCQTIGHNIRWHPDGTGVARDVDDDGRLVVDIGTGHVRLASGEVWEVR